MFLWWGILSGVTLFDGLDIEELLSMPGDKSSISIVVVYLGVTRVFVVTGVVAFGVIIVVSP